MDYTVRSIEPRDNAQVEKIIRSCLIEYGHDHEGTVWADTNLGRFSEVYSADGRAYFVAEDESGKVVACSGIGELDGAEGVCELQRMFALPEARGTGAANELMRRCLEFAKTRYSRCYLETLANMERAQRFYEKHGFRRLDAPLVATAHFACDVWYIKKL